MSDIYELLKLEQGTQEWKEERRKRMASSEVATILDLMPAGYQTISELIEEKITGQKLVIDSFKEHLFKKGHDAEKAGRQWLESKLGIKFPPVVLLSKRCPDLLASLDGFNQEKNWNLEAKFMGVKALEEVKFGKIKSHHMCQVQAQLLVSGAEKCIYFATTIDGDSAIKEIKPDVDYQNRIISAVYEFQKDINDLRDLLKKFENFKVQLANKHKNRSLPPLKTLPSGAIDPFRVRVR